MRWLRLKTQYDCFDFAVPSDATPAGIQRMVDYLAGLFDLQAMSPMTQPLGGVRDKIIEN